MGQHLDKLYLVSLIIGVSVIAAIWLGPPFYTYPLTDEDHTIENLSAIFYFLGAATCIYIIAKKGGTGFIYLWLVLCILFLGEETSWFQRVFNYSVPMVEKHNAQGEFNFHNLSLWSARKFVDQEGNWQFNLATLFTSQNIFRLGMLVYFLVLPILYHWERTKPLLVRLCYPNPPALLVGALWATLVLSFLFATVSTPLAKDALAETREMFYAYFIFVYLLTLALTQGCTETERDYKEGTQAKVG